MPQSEADRTARDIYDDPAKDSFYERIYGGEDIHLGIYEEPGESIAAASRRTMERMADKIEQDTVDDAVDLGSGYCGAARFLHRRLGASVTGVNVSLTQNKRARTLNEEAGLDSKISVLEGTFSEVPAEDESFDLAWSEDAFLHTDRRDTVIAEAARVLRSGGELVFTDPMAVDGTPPDQLQAVFERIHLTSLSTPSEYRSHAARAGLTEVGYEDLTPHLTTHYQRVIDQGEAERAQLRETMSDEEIDNTISGLQNWVDAGKQGLLTWGIFHFRKP